MHVLDYINICQSKNISHYSMLLFVFNNDYRNDEPKNAAFIGLDRAKIIVGGHTQILTTQ